MQLHTLAPYIVFVYSYYKILLKYRNTYIRAHACVVFCNVLGELPLEYSAKYTKTLENVLFQYVFFLAWTGQWSPVVT